MKTGNVRCNEVHIVECCTPKPESGMAKFYGKTDGKVYIMDENGNEIAIPGIGKAYGHAYYYNNSTPLAIATADTPVGMLGVSEGLTHGVTFHTGSSGVITAFADYGGTVEGTVLATSAGHGLSTGDIVTHMGTTNYNGVFEVTVVSVDTYYFTAVWVADDATGTWIHPSHFSCDVGYAGDYKVSANISCSLSAAANVVWVVYKNTTAQTQMAGERKFPINDVGTAAMSGLVTLAEGDTIWMSVSIDDTVSITPKHGGMNINTL